MDVNRDIDGVILELQSILKVKYGEDFNKFYLVNQTKNDWQILISTKDNEGGRESNYYKIENDHILEDNIV